MASSSENFWLKLGLVLFVVLQTSEAGCCIHYHWHHIHHKGGGKHKEESKEKEGSKHKEGSKKSLEYGVGHAQSHPQVLGQTHINPHENNNGNYNGDSGSSHHSNNIPNKHYTNSEHVPGSAPISSSEYTNSNQPNYGYSDQVPPPVSHANPGHGDIHKYPAEQPWKPLVGYTIQDPPYRKKVEYSNEIARNNPVINSDDPESPPRH